MHLSILPNLLVQATLLHRGLSVVVEHSNQVPKFHPRDQIILNMGSSWSSPASKGEEIFKPADVVAADPSEDPRYRRFTHLLKLNHHDHSLFYHDLQYHNHLPYALASAYIFGASKEHLHDIYEVESKELEQWQDSPEEIDPDNWRAHLGDMRYQRAYLNFFEDEMEQRGHDWKATLWHFLTDKQVDDGAEEWDNHQLLYGLTEGLGHPLIHLGYALELEDKGLAMEALAMAAASYNKVHELVDDPYPPLPFISTNEIREILDKLFDNRDYDDICSRNGMGKPGKILEDPPYFAFYTYVIEKEKAALLAAFQKQVEASVMLFATSHKVASPQYDFFLAHTVTTAHALRIILPHLDTQQTWHLVRAHMILISQVYLSQCKPTIKDWFVEDYDIGNKDWEYIRKKALEGEYKYDAHYVKIIRSLHEFDKLFGAGEPKDKNYNMYLKAAVKFADEFKGWIGFGNASMSKLDIKKLGDAK
ncbi:uncharacterized protein DFL_007110 [Arthrobotrys flagrans]|uniref:Oxidoreductase AflY n=1 Tax=Arthrobotrys flagrans TaxID=97331 RepID=A0A436ZUQ0_ARTFL|nr:hypothetical protein DFL_007110 [Arthrobotrys flagrans]